MPCVTIETAGAARVPAPSRVPHRWRDVLESAAVSSGARAGPIACAGARPVSKHSSAATWITAPRTSGVYPGSMVEITIERRWGGYTFLLNGRDDVVVDPVWGVTTFDTEDAAREVATLVVRALLRAGTGRAGLT